MGQVYLAQHPRLPRQDALKVLQPDLSNDGDFRQRFIREADLAASLSHPNIVKVHDRGEFEGQLWIATEYVDGTDAGQLLRERYPEGMPVEEACGILTAIASALDNAHDSGLLHRDIKPANIPLTKPDRFGQRQIYLAYSGPSATGSLTPDENGPFNVVVVAFIKTSAGTVASTVNMHCVRAGQIVPLRLWRLPMFAAPTSWRTSLRIRLQSKVPGPSTPRRADRSIGGQGRGVQADALGWPSCWR